jgi:hypothetical protein
MAAQMALPRWEERGLARNRNVVKSRLPERNKLSRPELILGSGRLEDFTHANANLSFAFVPWI